MALIISLSFYFILMLAIGLAAGRRIKTVENYLVANRRLPLFLAVPTIVATWFGAGSCMGVSSTVYENGFYEVIPDPFGCSLALLLAGLFFASRFRREGSLTIADILKKTYGRQAEKWASILMLPFYIGTLASQMLALGYIFHIMAGIEMQSGIIMGSLIVLIYTMAGGMWAVSCTDLAQMLFLAAAMGCLFFTTWQSCDTSSVLDSFFREFSHLLPQKRHTAGITAYTGQIVLTGMGAIMGQDLIQRFFSCKNEKTARNSTLISAVFYLALGFIPLFIGVAAKEIYPSLDSPQLLLPRLAQDMLSPFAFSIFAAGLIAAIMSTADSYLLAGTSILTQNLMTAILAKSRRPLLWMRSSSLLIAACAYCLTLFSTSIYNLMVHSGATLFVSIFIPTTAALYWKKAHRYPKAGGVAMLSGFAGWSVWALCVSKGSLSFEEHLFAAAVIGGSLSLVSYLGTAFFLSRRIQAALP